MRLNTLMKGVAAAAVALVAVSAAGEAEARTKWKIHSAFGRTLFVIGPGPYNVSKAVKAMSNGELDMHIFEPGALVPSTTYYDPVSSGSIDGAWGTPGYNVHKNFAYAFFSAVPFGPGAGEYLGWWYHGGGRELAEEMYAKDNIKMFLCNLIAPESSGWFRNEIKSTADLKGLKMRFFGLGAKVMEKFGVSTQLLAGGDIYPALELGSIDATEFSMPAIDKDLGFYQIAKHNYFPGWHQQSTLGEMVFNMDKFNKISDGEKVMLEQACKAQVVTGYAETEAKQGAAMAFHESKGVTIHRWSPDILAQFEGAWKEVIAEEIKSSPEAAKIWASMSKFRDEYKVWKKNGYLD
jgi:TRAP-type mannitol/chloroaromatic compound transport system substrate-binding protein